MQPARIITMRNHTLHLTRLHHLLDPHPHTPAAALNAQHISTHCLLHSCPTLVPSTHCRVCCPSAAMSAKELAQAAKAKGNAAFSAGKYDEAVTHFTEAITHDPTDAIFYSNRSGAFASLNQPDSALDDANQCIALNPQFAKGYSRKGHALHSLGKYAEAKEAYSAGLAVDPTNTALKEALTETERALTQPPPSQSNPFASMFGPDMWGKLMQDPSTKGHLSDPQFVAKMNELQRNPSLFGQYAKDPKVGQAMGVLLGLGADVFGGRGGGMGGMGGMGGEGGGMDVEDEEDDDGAEEVQAGGQRQSYQPPPRASEQKQEQKAQSSSKQKPESEMTEEEKKKRDAEREKEAGNKLFTAKKFDEAISHYQRAAELDPTNIVYLNNTAACQYEKKDYPACIQTSMKAVELGREQMSNYKDIAKAWLRVGNAHAAEKRWSEAIDAYEKSLVEDISDKAKVALKKAQEQRRKAEDSAYINPELSEQEKMKGNELFSQQRWIDAIGHYTEALKRNPNNYKVYSNRAACYAKLMDWERGLADCEACLKQDPTFVKAYIRKGKIHHFLKQYHKALEAFEKGLSYDADSSELKEERMRTMAAINTGEADPERAKEAMKDPEIQQILRDPTINKVLQDLQQNPQAGQAALRDKDIRAKIEKLIAAGVLATK